MIGCPASPELDGGGGTGTRSDSAVGGNREAEAAAARIACMCVGRFRPLYVDWYVPVLRPPLSETWVSNEDVELGTRFGPAPGKWPGGFSSEVEYRSWPAASFARLNGEDA